MVITDDYSNIDEPKTNREMYQKIIHMIQEANEDRQEDRELLEKFIGKQGDINKSLDDQLRKLNDCVIQHSEAITTLKDSSKKWDITNTIGVLLVAILSALGLKNS